MDRQKINPRQLEAAYQLALGVSENDDYVRSLMTESVSALGRLIKQFFDAGLPVNLVAELITDRRESESAEFNYNQWVVGLDITAQEKNLLQAIVAHKRTGRLWFTNKKTGRDILTLIIPEPAKSDSIQVWISNIKENTDQALAGLPTVSS